MGNKFLCFSFKKKKQNTPLEPILIEKIKDTDVVVEEDNPFQTTPLSSNKPDTNVLLTLRDNFESPSNMKTSYDQKVFSKMKEIKIIISKSVFYKINYFTPRSLKIVESFKDAISQYYFIFHYVLANLKLNSKFDCQYETLDITIQTVKEVSFALVFQEICVYFKLPTLVASGIVRITTTEETKRTWNFIEIDNLFYIVDCYAAQQIWPVDDKLKKTASDFFFANSAQFCTNYFSYESPKGWPNRDLASFLQNNVTSSLYFILGFGLDKMQSHSIELNANFSERNLNECKFNFCMVGTCALSAKIKYNEATDLPGNLVFIQRFDSELRNFEANEYYNNFVKAELGSFEIKARLPKAGKYSVSLGIYADNDWWPVTSVEIFSSYDEEFILPFLDPDFLKFPLTFSGYFENKCQLVSPLHYYLSYLLDEQEEVDLVIKVPNSKIVSIFMDEELSFEKMTMVDEDVWSKKINRNDKFSKLSVAVGNEDLVFDTVCEFQFA